MAEKFALEGSNIAINYVSSADRAKELAAKIEADYKVKAVTLQGVGLCLFLQKHITKDRLLGCGRSRRLRESREKDH